MKKTTTTRVLRSMKFPTCIVGMQWGDEGKGKLIDYLSKYADYVVRYQGGPNAGHTVYSNNRKIVLHHIPAGIFYGRTKCVIANGVVIDPEILCREIDTLRKNGITVKNRLLISERAHVLLPVHRDLDKFNESGKAVKIGTTLKGVGPCYNDKISRIGMRIIDLLNKRVRDEKIKQLFSKGSKLLGNGYYRKSAGVIRSYTRYARRLKEYSIDSVTLLNDIVDSKKVIFEGANGTLLSIEFGTYPFVTSSCSEVSGVSSGTGVPPTKIKSVIGISKAYATRVGGGPFPSELKGVLADRLQKSGDEFGSTTGRRRRVGWLDMVSSRYAVTINGITSIAITKLDVLSGFEYIYVCTGYRYRGSILKRFPADIEALNRCKPILRRLKGWNRGLSGCKEYRDLPVQTRSYIKYIEDNLAVAVNIISVGKERWQTLVR